MDMQVRPQIGALGRDRFHKVSQPPDDSRTRLGVRCDDEKRFPQDHAFPHMPESGKERAEDP
jgi:hypothetical protein